MINFIVLEDNPNCMKKMKDIIMKYMMQNKYDFDILHFEKVTEEFFNLSIKYDHSFIYLLNNKLSGVTAIDVARRIRKKDWTSPIIILTEDDNLCDPIKHRLQILDCVNKYLDIEKNLHELFSICINQFKLKHNFKYKIGKVDYSIDFDKILYIYKDTLLRKSIFVTDRNRYEVPLNLVKVKTLLNDDFVFTHKSCIINKKRAQAYMWSENKIIFDNGKSISYLSKTHKKEIEFKEVC